MKIIYNKHIPFNGFAAITICGRLYIRHGVELTARLMNHEEIHERQQRELLYLPFFLWYIIEYIVRLFMYKFDTKKAYRNISFEREAYQNELNFSYLESRKTFAFISYLKEKLNK